MQKDCYFCVYHKDGECLVNIDEFTPELAKALYTNEEIEL